MQAGCYNTKFKNDNSIRITQYCIAFTEVIKLKTKIIFESQNVNAEQKNINKDFENQVKRSIFLALKEKGYLTQSQYDECIKRM